MINLQQYKGWVNSHRILSFILVALLFLAILFQTLVAVDGFNINTQPTEYAVIDLDFDSAKVEASAIEEGTGMGASLYRIFLNKRGTSELISMIQDKPNNIYLINLRGTTPINEQWMLGEKFAVELYGICGLKAAEIVGANEDLKGFCESVILHFPSQKAVSGWSSFSEGLASCCDNYFRFRGFYRFAFFRDKQDRSNQYQAKNIEPNPEIAARTIESLEAKKYYQIYADK